MNDNSNPSDSGEQEGKPPEEAMAPEVAPEAVSQPGSSVEAPALAPGASRPSRKPLRANVTWRGAIQISNQPQPIKIVNVSDGVIGVLTEMALPMGQSFQMALLVPLGDDLLRQEQVMLTGKVVHSVISAGMYRISMQIVSISDAHGRLIRDWVAAHGKSA